MNEFAKPSENNGHPGSVVAREIDLMRSARSGGSLGPQLDQGGLVSEKLPVVKTPPPDTAKAVPFSAVRSVVTS